MHELRDEDIKSEIDAIMKRIDNIIKNIGELSPEPPPSPLPDEHAE